MATTPNPTVASTVEQLMAQANDLVRSALTLSHAKIAEYPNLLISIQSEEAKLRLLVEALAVDAERLDFIASERVLVHKGKNGLFWLMSGDGEHQQVGSYKTPREAIDAAIDAARTPLTTQGELPGSEGV